MNSFSVIKRFDPFEDFDFCFFSCWKIFVINKFSFKGVKKTFHWRIIPAITFSAHTLNEAVLAVEQLFCLTHARRGFFTLYKAGKKELEYVIDLFAKIYEADRKTEELTPEERLQYLKKHAQAPVTQIKEWMTAQLVEKKVEPNSALGKHIKYCEKRWPELTKFLTIPGVPLTNDETERKIKTAVVRRKNSLF